MMVSGVKLCNLATKSTYHLLLCLLLFAPYILLETAIHIFRLGQKKKINKKIMVSHQFSEQFVLHFLHEAHKTCLMSVKI